MHPTKINHNDVQGIFRGFDRRWPVGRFFYCHYGSPQSGRDLLHRLGPPTSYRELHDSPDVAINVAFTYPGLLMLGLTPEVLQSFPGDFRQGMGHRAKLNGDIDSNGPESWEDYWRDGGNVHAWVGVYARDADALEEWAAAFEAWVERYEAPQDANPVFNIRSPVSVHSLPGKELHIERAKLLRSDAMEAPIELGITIVGRQDVRRFWSDETEGMYIDEPESHPTGKPVVLEHFGFRDGLSNPVISGLDQTHLTGSGKLDKKGRWAPLAAGEFLFGYVDEMGEIPLAPVPPTLAKNGSFMVHRKLEQDVDGFRAYLTAKAAEVSSNGSQVSADYLAMKLVGRKRDGTPLADTDSMNDFTFADDRSGHRCPMGAHIRRGNPRNTLHFDSLLVNRHRILRRAITYGDPVPHDKSQREVNPYGQGIMFITLQADITRQFEFVQQQWMNFGNDFSQGNDRDPIAGTQVGDGRMTIPGDGDVPTVICDKLPSFVNTRGGDYFFLPGVGAFNLLADGSFTVIDMFT